MNVAKRTLMPAGKRNGFSMMELLAVIALVAIIAVLLLPVVFKVQAMGRQAQCTSNLRQIVAAYLSRVVDDGGLFPPSRTGKLYDPDTGGTTIPKGAQVQNMLSAYIADPLSQLSQPGAKPSDAGVYWCPARDPSQTSLSIPSGQHPIYSYAHNTELGGQQSQPTQSWLGPEGGNTPNPNYNPALARLAAVREPSRIIAFAEQANPGNTSAGHLLSSSWPFPTNSARQPPATGRQIDFTRHRGRANAAFLDGSVRPMTFEDLRGTRAQLLVPTVP